MTRSALCFAGGSIIALGVVALSPVLDGSMSAARSETFDARWAVLASTAKQDRLAPPRPSEGTRVLPTVDAQRAITTLEKVEVAANEPGKIPTRKEPGSTARKEKLPVGCDPSFSPVAVPSMAHVTGRCLAAAETGRKYAELSK